MKQSLDKEHEEVIGHGSVKSGINGLDELLNGGFDQGSIVLIAGPPGSGKSIMAAQFIYNGAAKYGEAGLYVNFTENKNDFFRNMARLGMNFKWLEEEGMFRFIDACNVLTRRSLDVVFSYMLDELVNFRVKRIVIDPFNAVTGMVERDELKGLMTTSIIGMSKVNHATCILVGNTFSQLMSDELAEAGFICDVVIRLEAKIVGDVIERFMVIDKVRGRKTLVAKAEYVITDRGVSVFVPATGIFMSGVAEEQSCVKLPELDVWVDRGSVTLVLEEKGLKNRGFLADFAASGVLEGEKVLYVAFSDLSCLRRNFRDRGCDVDKIGEEKLRIIGFMPLKTTPGLVLLALRDALKVFQPRRVAVDDLSAMKWLPPEDYRRLVNEMVALIRAYGVTSMISLTESPFKARGSDEARLADNVLAVTSRVEGGKVIGSFHVIKANRMKVAGKQV